MTYIDLNVDCGECIPWVDEEAILRLVTTCNIACGGHVGDLDSMKITTDLALKFHLNIGAHPSYPDRINFGRKSLIMSSDLFMETIIHQVDSLIRVLKESGGTLKHIKAHGALYHDLNGSAELANWYLDALAQMNTPISVMTMPGGCLEAAAHVRGIPVIKEAFADRRYLSATALVQRRLEDAIISTPQQVLEQIQSIALEGVVSTRAGKSAKVEADSFCVHSDHTDTLQILQYIHDHMETYHLKLASK